MNKVLTVAIVASLVLMTSCTLSKDKDDYPSTAWITTVPGTYRSSILHDGRSREFVYHIPPGYDSATQYPLVFALHGGGGDAQKMIDLTLGGFNDLADAEGFIVVYPEAYERNWNDGRNVPDIPSHSLDIDDVGFITRLAEHIADYVNIDESRVYSTGISNGGLMSLRLAIEASDRFAAVASVAANMPENLTFVSPQGPVPVAFLLGVEDPILPFDGGVILGDNGTVVSATASVSYWVDSNQCAATPQDVWLPDADPADETLVRKLTYTGGLEGSEVILYEVHGGGHTWPNGDQYLGVWLVGRTTRDIDGCIEIWNFFKHH